MILAGSSPDPGALGSWLLIGVFVLMAIGQVKTVFSKKPSHAELATKKELQKYVTQPQLNEFKTEVRGDMREIKAMIKSSTEKVEGYAEKSYLARKAIHTQVNGIDKGLTKAETRIDEHAKQITDIRRNA